MKNETIRKMQEIRLSAMAEAFEMQLQQPERFEHLSFEERLAFLVDREYDIRRNNHLQRLLKNATLVYPNATLRNIEYLPDRHLNRDLLKRLESNEYIQHHANIVIIGAMGSGKTYLANALATNACYDDFKVKYMRLPNIFAAYREANYLFPLSARSTTQKDGLSVWANQPYPTPFWTVCSASRIRSRLTAKSP